MRRLLDPLGGDILDHPQRRLRLNLRRVERMAILSVATAAMEGILSFQRQSFGNFVFCVLGGLVSLTLLFLARYGQRHTTPSWRYMPEIFIVYILLSSQLAGYFIALSGRLAVGYPIAYIVCAAFFIVPPRRFALIGLGTMMIFAAWILALPFDPFNKFTHLYNSIFMIAAGMLGRWGLSRLEEVNQQQREQITAQNAALAAANDRLTAHNAELNSLMAIAAHDLRSPLYGLNNLLELAGSRPPASQEAWRELLREAGTSVTSMLGLIGRILEAHEAETETVREPRSADLRGAVDAAVRRAGATATRARITLAPEAAPGPVFASFDPDALDQILDNLLSNAIRFSPPGSTVRLRAGCDPVPFVEVADEGVGIAPEQRQHLFGKFRRGAARPVNGPRGSGLGLYIVQTLATAMNASVAYRPAPAGGSTFRLELTPPKPEKAVAFHEPDRAGVGCPAPNRDGANKVAAPL